MKHTPKEGDSYALKLACLNGINNQHKHQLLEHYSQAKEIFNAPLSDIKALLKLSHSKLEQAFHKFDESLFEMQCSLLNKHAISVIPYNSSEYPAQLKQIPDAPAILFARGDIDLLSAPQLAIVGSRNASPSGNKTAKAFASDFSQSGLSITSGLALGIDTAAHLGAIDNIGKTIAVVATGLDEVYPKRNLSLAKAIVSKGLMVSEFPPLSPARRDHFPRRNRIISGLSLGVLVVEADTRSGSLITARLAGEQGREIFAIPGSIHLPTSRGCHQLIRQGAKLVETTADVLLELKAYIKHELYLSKPKSSTNKTESSISHDDETMKVLKVVDFAPTSVDEIVTHSNLPVDLVSSILLQLELNNEIAPLAGNQYQRI